LQRLTVAAQVAKPTSSATSRPAELGKLNDRFGNPGDQKRSGNEVLFCFPALRFEVFSPYRSSRYCGAPKPGKEKHKGYDYRSAILIVHGFQSFLSVFTSLVRNICREVTRKMAAQFEAWRLQQS
jgi:hypothetical protein